MAIGNERSVFWSDTRPVSNLFSPSLQSTFGLLRHSLEGHHLATLKWPDIENPWLSSGLAATYVSDRGSDYRSLRYRMAIRSLGAEYQYCEVRTPWHKASIERFFGTVETTFLESLPGKTFRCLANRMDYDSSGTAVIRFSVLVYLLHKWAADFHNVFPTVDPVLVQLIYGTKGLLLHLPVCQLI